jgi:acetyl-CoA acyltransferase
VSQIGEQSFDIARTSLLSAGWPECVPGTTIDRQCGSSQQALHFAAAGIVSRQYDVAVAGGVEAMSRIPIGSAFQGNEPLGKRYQKRYGPEFPNQGIGAEMIADEWGLSRPDLDSFALESHARAAATQDAGLFADEIAPIDVEGHTVSADEGVRRGSTMEKLAGLPPAFREDARSRRPTPPRSPTARPPCC